MITKTERFKALQNNRTKLTSQSVFQSAEDRNGILQSGMEEGFNDSYECLDKLLEKLQKNRA
jgi:uncharacterized protein YndB with AHSA1/START domain